MEVHPTQKGSHLENETFSFVERESGQANADTLQLQQLLSTQHNFPTVGEASFSKDVSSERADYSTKKKAQNFKSFGLNKDLLSSIQKMGYKCPTPIQRKAIPILLSGRDVIAMARTGSGKTAAYLLPMLQKLSCHNTVMGIRGLVLSPTRELALQTFRFVRELSFCTDLRSCAIVGGVALEDQYADLSGNPDIVVATPGRFLHVLEETQMKELKRMIYLVLDEGDRLFEMGFHAQIIEVLKYVPEHAQRSLFSATMPAVLAEFAAMRLNQPVLLRLESEMKLPEHLALSFFVIRDEERLPLLLYLLDHVLRPQQTSRQVALFCATKYHAEFYASFLEHHHYLCSLIHGTLDQEARREALSYFHQRKRTILVVTDVAARGIDIPSLDFVININFPSSAKLFVHRVGRVARAGRSGTAISFVGMDEAGYLLDIRQTLKHKLSTDINSADKPIEQFERQPYLNTDVSPVGLVPNILTQQYNQMVQSYLSRDTELQALQKRANNAYKQYKRTRPAPSSTSLSLTKSFLAALPVHSDLTMSMTQVLGGNEALCERRSELLKCIAAHRNKANIFHIDDGRTPKKAQPNDEVFKRKQWEAEQFVKRVQEKKSRSSEGAVPMKKSAHAPGEIPPNAPLPMTRTSEKSKRTLDPQTGITHAPLMDKDAARLERRKRYRYGDEAANYFVPYEPVSSCDGVADVDGAQSFKDATMDIHADTLEGEQARRSVYVWNAKKRRYMKENLSKAKLLMQGLRNEAGAKIERRNKDDNNSSGGGGGKRGTSRRAENNKASYARWSARTKRIIPAVGESEDPESGSLLRRQRSKYGFTVPSPLGDNAEGEENPSEGNVNGPNSAKHKRPQKNKTARKVRQPSKGKGSKKSKVRGNKKRFG